MALVDHRDHPVPVTLSVLVTFPVFPDEKESLGIREQLVETERLDGTEKTVNRECPVSVGQTVYLDLPGHPGKFPSSRLTVIVVRNRNFNFKSFVNFLYKYSIIGIFFYFYRISIQKLKKVSS